MIDQLRRSGVVVVDRTDIPGDTEPWQQEVLRLAADAGLFVECFDTGRTVTVLDLEH